MPAIIQQYAARKEIGGRPSRAVAQIALENLIPQFFPGDAQERRAPGSSVRVQKARMRIYYIDEPLDDDEIQFVKESIAHFEDIRSIPSLEQIRVATVLPTPNKDGQLDMSIEQVINLVTNALIKAGIEKDQGNQVTWVVPKEMRWSALFQTAIHEITGFSPYVAQRWYADEEGVVRGDIRVLDGHGILGGKG